MKHQFQNILFDLDGTITDPMESITSGVAYALSKFGITVTDLSTLTPFIGPPLPECLKTLYGFTEEQAQLGLKYYREIYSVNGVAENRIYDGMADLLKSLKEQGKHIMLATSKPQEYARPILELAGVLQYFDFVGGNDLKESRPRKDLVIRYVMENYPSITPENTIMVGDRKYDVLGARACGLGCIGVLYGYGSREELMECHADYIAEDIDHLRSLLLDA